MWWGWAYVNVRWLSAQHQRTDNSLLHWFSFKMQLWRVSWPDFDLHTLLPIKPLLVFIIAFQPTSLVNSWSLSRSLAFDDLSISSSRDFSSVSFSYLAIQYSSLPSNIPWCVFRYCTMSSWHRDSSSNLLRVRCRKVVKVSWSEKYFQQRCYTEGITST